MNQPTFTDSRFCTAQEKQKALEGLKKFIENGMKRNDFKKEIYKRLTSDFNHMAHYDIDGFYIEWCSTPSRRLAWMNHLLMAPGYQDSHEVVVALQDWIRGTNQYVRYESEKKQEYDELLADLRKNPEAYVARLMS